MADRKTCGYPHDFPDESLKLVRAQNRLAVNSKNYIVPADAEARRLVSHFAARLVRVTRHDQHGTRNSNSVVPMEGEGLRSL